jgi:Fe-S cluster assembly protein SufD
MITANYNQSWLSEHSELQMMGSDVAWLNEQRQAGLAQFEKVGLPGVRDEDWRYTNLRALKSNDFSVSSSSSLSVELAETTNPRLVFVDGHLDTAASTGLSEHVSSLKDSLDSVSSAMGSTLPKNPHGFTALNSAYAQDGYVVHLKPGIVLDGVLEVVFVSQTVDAVSHTRNLIIAEANTQCTVVERHIGVHGTVYLNNIVTEIIAGDNAHIDHYKIQQESDDAFHMGGVFINQASSSQVKNHNIALSGLVTRNDVYCNLLGQGAHMEMNGLVLGQGRQHIDNHTEVNHAVPNCTSDEYYKTVLDEHSRSIFRGRIIVAEDAQQTNADQQNNNLLLSKNAEADCKPQLEIYADDVKCSHGVTVGQLNPVSLFYLKSRGIDADSANALLTFAFANEVIDRVKVPSVREELTQIMAGELLSGLEDLV